VPQINTSREVSMTNTQSGSSKSGSNVGSNRQQDMEDRKTGSQQGDKSQSEGNKSQRGGPGDFANDREKASEAGRKGGQHSHGGPSK
jgi:hypothetical protein